MNRTVILFVLFLLLGAAAVWYLGSRPEERSTVLGWDRNFAVEPEAVHKIFLADRRGNKTTLERTGDRTGDHWTYNERWRARPNAMENLLNAIGRIEMKYKPPRAAVPNMIRDLAANGIKVELYDRGGDLIKIYYVGGATPDETGTYVIMDGAEEPYVAHLPGWQGNLRFRYNLRGDDWRDKAVFAERPENIQAVTVEYPKQQAHSFKVKKKNGAYRVEPYGALRPRTERACRPGSAETFLYGFERLAAEAFENDNPRRDSIRRLRPFCTITLQRTDGTEKTVRFYPIFEKFASGGQVLESNRAERYFADVSTGDFMLVQNRIFREIFWSYEMFFEPES